MLERLEELSAIDGSISPGADRSPPSALTLFSTNCPGAAQNARGIRE
jgi:hypothetical protein